MLVKNQIELKEQSEVKGKFVITMDKGDIKHGKNKIAIGIYGDGELIEKKTTVFMGPCTLENVACYSDELLMNIF